MFELLERWRRPWIIEIVGTESGECTSLPFLRFGTPDEAEDWIKSQKVLDHSLTFYRVADERIKKRRHGI